jgi:hypothetical protein
MNMTGRQELKQHMVKLVADWNYRSWRLGIGDPDEKAKRQLEDVKRHGGTSLTMTPYTKDNIWGGVWETNLSSAINYQVRNLSERAQRYYANCTDKGYDRFINEILKEANDLTASYQRSYKHQKQAEQAAKDKASLKDEWFPPELAIGDEVEHSDYPNEKYTITRVYWALDDHCYIISDGHDNHSAFRHSLTLWDDSNLGKLERIKSIIDSNCLPSAAIRHITDLMG